MATKDRQTIDTNVLLRLALNDVLSQYEKAARLVTNGNIYYIPTQAITEAVFTMERGKYGLSREAVVEILGSVMGWSCFEYEKDLFDEVFPFYLAHPKLSFNDCLLSFETAQKQMEPLWTFDKNLAKQSPVAKEIR